MAIGNYDIKKELKRWLGDSGRIVVAGIGNPIRMDDYVGVKIVQDLRRKVSDRVLLIECDTVPESFIQDIINFSPSHVLLIDAAVIGLKPGEARLVKPEKLTDYPAFSTHMLPLRIFCEYVSKATGANIAMLLLEPKRVDFGEGLTSELAASAKVIEEALLKFLGQN